MPSTNPNTYYSDEDLHGEYAFVGIEDLVNNFLQNYTGDDTLLGHVPRQKVVYQVKQGIREFTMGFLNQVRAVELELNDANNIILPVDFVQYVRISWVDQRTGRIRPMSQNRHTPLGVAYLQDNVGDILFDNNGEILEGTTAIEAINDNLPANPSDFPNYPYGCFGIYSRYQLDPIFNYDTTINSNGTFNINDKRIHFGADSTSRIILLEYISDGLQVAEDEIKIHKFAEVALYDYIHHNLAKAMIATRVPDYEKRNLKKAYDTSSRNARLKLLKINPTELIQLWKAGKTTIR